MSPDSGFGPPAWFVAIFVIVVLIAVGTGVWRVSMARKMARDAGLDPNTATAVTLLGKDGFGAAYLASTLRAPSQPPKTPQLSASTEQRLEQLTALKDKNLITEAEYEARRNDILDAI